MTCLTVPTIVTLAVASTMIFSAGFFFGTVWTGIFKE